MYHKLFLSKSMHFRSKCWKIKKFSTKPEQKLKLHPKYVPGKLYHNFLCKRVEYIPDFNMFSLIFKHEKTGLEYIHIDRNDSNNLFSINFRTTPFDSTGLPHILEVCIQ